MRNYVVILHDIPAAKDIRYYFGAIFTDNNIEFDAIYEYPRQGDRFGGEDIESIHGAAVHIDALITMLTSHCTLEEAIPTNYKEKIQHLQNVLRILVVQEQFQRPGIIPQKRADLATLQSWLEEANIPYRRTSGAVGG